MTSPPRVRDVVAERDDQIRFPFLQHPEVAERSGLLAVLLPFGRELFYLHTKGHRDVSGDGVSAASSAMDDH